MQEALGSYNVVAVDCENSELASTLCKEFHITETPTILVFPDTHRILHCAFADFLLEVTHRYPDIQVLASHKSATKLRIAPAHTRTNTKHALLHDVYHAVSFGFNKGVFMGKQVLRDDEFAALQAWLWVLSQLLPDAARRMDVGLLLVQVQAKQSLTSEEWEEMLVESTFVSTNEQLASTCTGFSCQLWVLFHVLSINAQTKHVSALKVDLAVRGFITYFFGCAHCRDHFLSMQDYDASSNYALYLWDRHNEVNARLGHPSFPITASVDVSDRSQVHRFLQSTYCFSTSDLGCPPGIQMHEEGGVRPIFKLGVVVLFLGGVIGCLRVNRRRGRIL